MHSGDNCWVVEVGSDHNPTRYQQVTPRDGGSCSEANARENLLDRDHRSKEDDNFNEKLGS